MNTPTKVTRIVFGISIIFWIWMAVTCVRKSSCQSSFGLELNQKRRSLHIPVIPASWHIYYKDDTHTSWVPTGPRMMGHGFKNVVYEGCELDEEVDHYYFDLKTPTDTSLEVDYKYVNSKRHKDSTVYVFQIKDHPDTISSKKADSILTVHKTNLY